MKIQFKILEDIKKPDFMGCGAYKHCEENNLFHTVVPKNSIVIAEISDWENEWNDINVSHNGKEYLTNKKNCKRIQTI